MKAIRCRSCVVLAGAAILCFIPAGGCDSQSAYRPPTASVNGGPAHAENSVAEVAHAPRGPAATAATGYGESATDKDKPAPPRPKYFVDWPRPKLALVISGRQDGYLEPCGCAGLENQKGGLNRRHALLEQLEERGWPVTAVDVGGQVRRFGRQAEVQFTLIADALKQLGYGAVGLGTTDLRLSAGHILSSVAGAEPEDTIFVSANVSLFGLTPKLRIVEAGGLTLGITSVLGQEYQQQINNSEVETRPAAEALREVVPQLAECDIRVLLAHATVEETKELARQFPEFTLVVTADGADEPPAQPETIDGTPARLIEVGHKGMYVVVAGFFDDPQTPVRFQRVALDARYPNTPEMQQLMVTYQDQLQQLGWGGLGIRSVPHPRSKGDNELAGQFAGSASCKECHPTAWGVWSKTKHAHATESLVKAEPPRQFDAECVSCHVTGWNPQEYFPYAGGFDSLDKTPHLVGNGCENCHGPGAAHVAAENGRNVARRDDQRQAMKLTTASAEEHLCIQCHDLDNSPDYISKGFEEYWPKIEHKGKR